MKSLNKLLIGLGAATTILAPLVPKNVNINIVMEAKSPTKTIKPFKVVETQCDLVEKKVTDNGMQVCAYRCRDGDHIMVYKTYFGSGGVCSTPITEKVKITSR